MAGWHVTEILQGKAISERYCTNINKLLYLCPDITKTDMNLRDIKKGHKEL